MANQETNGRGSDGKYDGDSDGENDGDSDGKNDGDSEDRNANFENGNGDANTGMRRAYAGRNEQRQIESDPPNSNFSSR